MRDFRLRQALGLGLVGAALWPLPGLSGRWAAIPAFLTGWLSAELAPHLAVLLGADAITHLARNGRRADRLGLALAAGSGAGLAGVIRTAFRARGEVDEALRTGCGADTGGGVPHAPDTSETGVPWRKLVVPFRMREPGVVRHRDLPYAGGGRRFLLDVYHRRDTPSRAPVLLQVHGGAWSIGSKNEQGIPLMLHMAARGWVCVAPNYPLSPRARWPEHAVALKRALGWIREHGHRYGADPSFVAVTGGSAGGHLAALLALSANDPELQPGFEEVDTSVQACVPHYGVYDFAAENGHPAARRLRDRFLARWVVPAGAGAEVYRSASPLARIHPEAPPFLVVHGRRDSLIPAAQAREFVRRLREVSRAPVAYAELGGAEHAFDIFPSVRSVHVVRGVARFLTRVHDANRRARHG